jgi:Cdc6-like AAA superfamily ATPase
MKHLDYKRDSLDKIYTVYRSDYSEGRYDSICKLLEYLQKVGIIDTSFVSVVDRKKNVRVFAENRVVYDLLQEIINH